MTIFTLLWPHPQSAALLALAPLTNAVAVGEVGGDGVAAAVFKPASAAVLAFALGLAGGLEVALALFKPASALFAFAVGLGFELGVGVALALPTASVFSCIVSMSILMLPSKSIEKLYLEVEERNTQKI